MGCSPHSIQRIFTHCVQFARAFIISTKQLIQHPYSIIASQIQATIIKKNPISMKITHTQKKSFPFSNKSHKSHKPIRDFFLHPFYCIGLVCVLLLHIQIKKNSESVSSSFLFSQWCSPVCAVIFKQRDTVEDICMSCIRIKRGAPLYIHSYLGHHYHRFCFLIKKCRKRK